MINRILLALGIAAFALPQGSYTSIIVAGITCLIYGLDSKDGSPKFRVSIAIASFLAVNFLLISAPLATALLASSSLIKKHRFHALALVSLQTSISDSIVALLSNFFAPYHLEAAAPSFLAVLILICIDNKLISLRGLALPLTLVLGFIAQNNLSEPGLVMMISGLPALWLAFTAINDQNKDDQQLKERVCIGLLVIILGLSWSISPPRNSNQAYFYLPDATNSPEYKYFENYQEVSKFTGLNLKKCNKLEEIPPSSLVVLPWLTEKTSDEFKTSLNKLAKANLWTVVLVGEHTNMNGVADFVNSVTTGKVLNDDLTTPPGNQDISGPLRNGSVVGWRPDAVLNRGASVHINSLTDKVLLSGDGWWSEKDIGEWLWVGDYIWHPNDRNGRLTLAALKVDGNARWLVLGDSTPFLNRVLLSDPRPAKMILQMASLWPLFIKDLLLILMAIACVIGSDKKRHYVITSSLVASCLVWACEATTTTSWATTYIGQSTFDDRNFNSLLSKSKDLLNTDWKLIRTTKPLSDSNFQLKSNAVVFGLIDSRLILDSVVIENCHRLGSIKTDEGPFLMDAQVCKVSGPVDVLIGDKNETAAFVTKQKGQKILVVLDQKFLAQQAPVDNVKWLEETIKRIENESN